MITYHMVDDDSLACCQSQTSQERHKPEYIRESWQCAVTDRLMSKEYQLANQIAGWKLQYREKKLQKVTKMFGIW